jgi:hypothetical protein
LDLPPEAETHFRSLNQSQQASLIAQLRARQQAKQQKQERLRLGAMASVLGMELENFTESEQEEIKSLIVNGKLEEAASYAGVDLASLSAAQLDALSEAMYEPVASPEKVQTPSTSASDTYAPYREAVYSTDTQQVQEEQQRRTDEYLAVVAEMNGGQYPAAPVESASPELDNDPYRELREYQDGEAEETEPRMQTYVEQAAASERGARRTE